MTGIEGFAVSTLRFELERNISINYQCIRLTPIKGATL